jgi:AmiR/NasT family two-component response regulator
LVVGQAFADMATLILLTPHDLGTSEIADRTRQALEARTVVEQAKGVLSYQNGVSIDRAYDLLLDMTLADGGTLSSTATAVIRRASTGT